MKIIAKEEEESIEEIIERADKKPSEMNTYVTVTQCMKFLKVSFEAIVDLLTSQQVEATRIGNKSLRVKLSSLMKYVNSRKITEIDSYRTRRSAQREKKSQPIQTNRSTIPDMDWEIADLEIDSK